jgi:hypothetical protein
MFTAMFTQEATTAPYPEPDESSQHRHAFKIHFNIIFLSKPCPLHSGLPTNTYSFLSKISDSHGGEYEDDSHLGIASFSLVEVYRRFRGVHFLYHQAMIAVSPYY